MLKELVRVGFFVQLAYLLYTQKYTHEGSTADDGWVSWLNCICAAGIDTQKPCESIIPCWCTTLYLCCYSLYKLLYLFIYIYNK